MTDPRQPDPMAMLALVIAEQRAQIGAIAQQLAVVTAERDEAIRQSEAAPHGASS